MADMIGDLIAGLTLVFALALICGTVIICMICTHNHHERVAEAEREEKAVQREEARQIRARQG